MRCPSCGEENPDRARFCLNCGTPLSSAPTTSRQERKVVTVLFCDLVGFTSASESADPEDVQARLSAYHSMLRTEVQRFGGTVEKFIGDAVMAAFGAPLAHEDDAERAVRAGLRILEATEELNDQQPGLDLQVRVGINTGQALVSLSAHPERGEGFVTGDVVNTASRLQGAAPVGGVAVGEQTYASTKDVFDYVELPAVELKGKAGKVRLFHALEARSRFGTDVTRRHSTPLVGREIDLALLRGAFDKALSGPALQLVTVVGEPGVGKSRLVAELFGHLDSLPELVRFRQGRCLPYGDGITFWAVADIVKAESGVLDSDDPAMATAKLQQAVARLIDDPSERAWFFDRLGPLLGLGAPSGSRDETFTAWRRFLEAAAAENPLVCVFEDLHWADEALLGFIEHLAEWSQGVPLLVVCTARPELYEQHPSWGAGLRNRFDISLAPLSTIESAKLVAALLGRAVLPTETQSLLVERSGGNPLYAEEFVRMLSDLGRLDDAGRLSVAPDDLPFPSSVQAIIAARLDTLPDDRKAVLQDAAVIGKVFWAGAVAALGGRSEEEVAKELHELAKKELVRPVRTSSVAGQLECSFWHAFVRDVAYNEIPRATRAARHAAAAEWIEGTAGDRVEEYAEILAHHYLTAARLAEATGSSQVADLQDHARRHLLSATRRAGYVDVPRAESLARSALEITPVGHDSRTEVEVRLADALTNAGRGDEAEPFLRSAIAEAESQGDGIHRARVLLRLARIVERQDPAEADRMLSRVIGTLERLPPGPELIDALHSAAARAMLGSRYVEVLGLADRVLRLLDEDGVRVEGPRDTVRAEMLHLRGISRFAMGDVGGLEDVHASLALCPDRSPFHNNLAMLLAVTDGLTPAVQEVEEAIRLATAQGARARALEFQETLFTFYFFLGRWDEITQLAPSVVRQVSDGGDEYTQISVESWLARVLLLRGEEHAAEIVASALPRAREISDPQVLVPSLVVAAIAAADGDDDERLARLLAEIEAPLAGVGEDMRPWYLAATARLAADRHDPGFAEGIIGADATCPASQASAESARATICEARQQLDEAILHYADAAQRWSALGEVVERAHALLGLGRSRLAVGDAEGAEDVLAARRVFADLHATPLLAEADRLLAAQQRLTS